MKRKILIVEDDISATDELKSILKRAGYLVCGTAESIKDGLELLNHHQPDIVLVNMVLEKKETCISPSGVRLPKHPPFLYLIDHRQADLIEKVKTLDCNGFIIKPFREKDVLILLEVAFHRHQNGNAPVLRRDGFMKDMLQSITARSIGWTEKLSEIATQLQAQIPFDFLCVSAKNMGNGPFCMIAFLRIGSNEYQEIGIDQLLQRAHLKLQDVRNLRKASVSGSEIVYFNGDQFVSALSDYPFKKVIADIFNLQSMLLLPIRMENGEMLSFSFYSRKADCYSRQHLIVAEALQPDLERAMNTIIPVEDVVADTVSVFTTESRPLRIAGENDYAQIIGKSHSMINVLNYVSMVAPVETSVLILGESGTGKEKIAKRIHALSLRKNQPFITVDCTNLPSNLVESLLFGHERGSFTGAQEKRIGKFEQAHKGTVFLDEIGELPLELQVKLLRVLQEKEIERVGGKGPIKIDVRIIAATNRNLHKEISAGKFRMDLYYRLNTFPITIPPLRDRTEDIPDLTRFFIQKYNGKTGRKVEGVSPKLLQEMMAYRWPGNIRELEHYIERAILMSSGPVINDLDIYGHLDEPIDDGHVKTIEENERDHILKILTLCNGKVSGTGGAAVLLNIPSTTLNSKIKKLGIKKDFT